MADKSSHDTEALGQTTNLFYTYQWSIIVPDTFFFLFFFFLVGQFTFIQFYGKMYYMKNWSTDTTRLQKNPEALVIWKLEQMVNFGLDKGERINEQQLRQHFHKLQIDPDRRKLFELLLYAGQ